MERVSLTVTLNYVQFVQRYDAWYFITINQLSILKWMTNNYFLRLCIV